MAPVCGTAVIRIAGTARALNACPKPAMTALGALINVHSTSNNPLKVLCERQFLVKEVTLSGEIH